ncbi:unnamed protein product, partial [Ectocarpus sp. 12 AP-2014]
SLRQSPTVHLVGADGVGDRSFSFNIWDRKSCAPLVSKPSRRLGAEQLGYDAIGFFLETGRCPGKELKTNYHFAVGARGVLCSYQAVCYGIFGCIGICRFPSMLRIANVVVCMESELEIGRGSDWV